MFRRISLTRVVGTSAFLLMLLIFYRVYEKSSRLRFTPTYNKRMKVLYADNVEGLTCINTSTKPSFKACLYNVNSSDESKRIIKEGSMRGSTELEVWLHMARAFRLYPDATFIDGGANIGFYTTLAAAIGLDVIAVEPVLLTARCIQKNMFANNFSRIVLLNNAILDEHTTVDLHFELEDKMGTVRIPWIKADFRNTKIASAVDTITLNDLAPIIRTKTAIIKLDIQGYECKALSQAEELLRTVYVPYIFVEWIELVRNMFKNNSPCSINGIRDVMTLLWSLKYKPYTWKGRQDIALDSKRLFSHSPINLYWKHISAKDIE